VRSESSTVGNVFAKRLNTAVRLVLANVPTVAMEIGPPSPVRNAPSASDASE